MLYALICRFKSGVEAERDALHEAFGDHLRQPMLHIRLACTIRHAESGERTGILLLIETDSRQSIDHFLAMSPYSQAGLYEHVAIDEVVIEAGGLT
jgi:uncharacterized protein YciI